MAVRAQQHALRGDATNCSGLHIRRDDDLRADQVGWSELARDSGDKRAPLSAETSTRNKRSVAGIGAASTT